MSWLISTLRNYPEIAIFLSLGIGYWVGGKSYRGFSLGAVTSTLLIAIVIGQFGITVSPNVKSVFFLMFLFAVGYGVGPQFVRGIAKDGLPQALFSVILCVLCLAASYIAAKIAGFDIGSSAGLFAGSQTISASMGLATNAIDRLNLDPAQTKAMLDAMPTAYAVTYIFGTIGSALLLAQLGPKLLGIDLVAVCKEYEQSMNTVAEGGGASTWHQCEIRTYKIPADGPLIGKTIGQAEALEPENCRMFIQGIRRNGKILDATTDLVLQEADIVAIEGFHNQLLEMLGPKHAEVNDEELSSMAIGGVDVYISNKEINGKTLHELGQRPLARGIYVRKIKRGLTETQIPVLAKTKIYQGDTVTLIGRPQDIANATKHLGKADKPTNITDVASVGIAVTIGALIGAVVIKLGNIPLTLSTAGGVLIAGLIFGWLRSIHPTFGRIPDQTVWFMNSVGLNVFIAVVGITAGPGFITGLQKLGLSLFLWGAFATAVPLILGIFIAKYIFRFHPALILGICAGARTTTAALGMICDTGKSQVPSLGYTVTYAVGNTLLTIWGMIIVMIMK